MKARGYFLILGIFAVIVLGGCSLSSNIKDLDNKSHPPPIVLDPKIKISPGHVESSLGPTGMKATISPTEEELSGPSLRARVSISQRHY